MDNMDGMHSHEPSKILIGVFGLSEYELRLLRSVLSLTTTSGRKHCFVLQDPSCGMCPDIAIVDPDNAATSAVLLRLIAQNKAATPAKLLIHSQAPANPEKYSLVRPLAPTRMLAMLDQIAATLGSNATAQQNQAAAPSQPAPQAQFQQQVQPASKPVPIAATVNTTASTHPTPVSAARAVESSPYTHRPSFRALVVDDSPTVRSKIELELRPYGVATDCVETGELGLQMLAKTEYDIVFLDIVLPGADGYEICRAIKHNRDTKRVPVVMLTSKSSPFDRIRGSLAGCSTYLTKPVDHATFHAVVERYLVAAQEQHAAMKAHALPAFA